MDYNNIGSEGLFLLGEKGQVSTVTGQEEALYTNPKKVVATLNLEVRGNNRTVSMNHCCIKVLHHSACVHTCMYRNAAEVPLNNTTFYLTDRAGYISTHCLSNLNL